MEGYYGGDSYFSLPVEQSLRRSEGLNLVDNPMLLIQPSTNQIPYDSSSLDAVVAISRSSYFPCETTYLEFSRILKPGGSILVYTNLELVPEFETLQRRVTLAGFLEPQHLDVDLISIGLSFVIKVMKPSWEISFHLTEEDFKKPKKPQLPLHGTMVDGKECGTFPLNSEEVQHLSQDGAPAVSLTSSIDLLMVKTSSNANEEGTETDKVSSGIPEIGQAVSHVDAISSGSQVDQQARKHTEDTQQSPQFVEDSPSSEGSKSLDVDAAGQVLLPQPEEKKLEENLVTKVENFPDTRSILEKNSRNEKPNTSSLASLESEAEKDGWEEDNIVVPVGIMTAGTPVSHPKEIEPEEEEDKSLSVEELKEKLLAQMEEELAQIEELEERIRREEQAERTRTDKKVEFEAKRKLERDKAKTKRDERVKKRDDKLKKNQQKGNKGKNK